MKINYINFNAPIKASKAGRSSFLYSDIQLKDCVSFGLKIPESEEEKIQTLSELKTKQGEGVYTKEMIKIFSQDKESYRKALVAGKMLAKSDECYFLADILNTFYIVTDDTIPFDSEKFRNFLKTKARETYSVSFHHKPNPDNTSPILCRTDLLKGETKNIFSTDPGNERFYLKGRESTPMKFNPNPKKGLAIDNGRAPYGTIGLSSRFNNTIYSWNFLQCAAVAIVDKHRKKQTLIHFFPETGEQNAKFLFKQVLRGSKAEDLEITIVPGCRNKTDRTIEYIKSLLKESTPESKIKYQHVGDKVHVSDVFIGLNNGELFYCNNNPELLENINAKRLTMSV